MRMNYLAKAKADARKDASSYGQRLGDYRSRGENGVPVLASSQDMILEVSGASVMKLTTVYHTLVWDTPGAEASNSIEIDCQAQDLDSNDFENYVWLTVVVSDTDGGDPSATATIAAKGTPLGTILTGSGTNTVTIKTTSGGEFGIKVTETAVGSRWLNSDPENGSWEELTFS